MLRTDLNNYDPIPESDNVIRYCSKNKYWSNGEILYQPITFQSGKNPDAPVSVNWIEYYDGDADSCFESAAIDCAYGNKIPSGRFLKLNVKNIVETGRKMEEDHKVLYSGDCQNPSHADITPPKDPTFAALCLCAEKHGELLEVPPSALTQKS